MKIVVLGLGHVGVVTAAALLKAGHKVIGVDRSDDIRDCVARGLSPVREPDVAALIGAGHAAGRLSVAADVGDGIDADLIFVCVGTRGLVDGAFDLSDLAAAARALGEAVRRRSPALPPILLVFRSTVLPGTMSETVLPTIVAAAGEPPGIRYDVAYNPEFSREGSAIADYFSPARIVVGERQPGSARALLELFAGIDAPLITTSFEVAELTKLADNSFHSLKVAFANEIGRFALRSGIPPSEVFDLFQADTKLNLSASYLRPGGAFGGPCLPKDVRALAARMSDVGITAPVIGHIVESNTSHTDFLIAEIERRAAPQSRLLLIGLSFKAGTDDLRESPFVSLAESLLDRGHNLSIYDPDLICNAAGSIPERLYAQLPSRLSSIILLQAPSAASWGLLIVGKSCPEVLRAAGANSPLFHIDRL